MSITTTSLALIIDQRCNIRCAHCCFSSGPKSTSSLSNEEIFSVLAQACDDDRIKSVGISGGEACLRWQLVLDLIEIIHNSGKTVTLNSNGFWGQSQQQAEWRVKLLKKAGLSLLTLSFDSFHQRFIPIKRIAYILDACRDERLRCHLNMAVSHDKMGTDLIKQLDDSVIGVPVTLFPVQRVGRGEAIDKNEIIRKVVDPHKSRCPGFEPTVLFDGRIFPCCSPSVFDTALWLGNINSISIGAAISSIEHNMLLYIIRREGFGWLYDTLCLRDKEFAEEVVPPFVDSCELCRTIFMNPSLLSAVRDEVTEHYYSLVTREQV